MPEIDSHNHPLWDEHSGTDPIMVTAVHSGHALRDELRQIMALDEKTRLREEDPFTDAWVSISDNYILPERSRFEADLLQQFPAAVRPTALITRDRQQIKDFSKQMGGTIVLKPLFGSGGRNVFFITTRRYAQCQSDDRCRFA